jgi:DMSO/TMAO reductase YedYZ heme-binding membrane subunit
MMGLQFGLTARFRYVTEPWGEDVIYHFHRQISLTAVGLVIAHPLILFAVQPDLRAPSSFIGAPLSAYFAVLSIFSLIALVVMALWRARLNISYEAWHLSHIVLAVVAVTAGLAHMVASGFYMPDPWKRALWIGLAIFWIALLLYVRIAKPLFMLRRPYRVSEVRKERGDTSTLVMQPDGHAGFRFTPGQFGWLTMWGSPFKITGHPFSFSSSAEATDGRVEMTIRNLGDFTSAMEHVPAGQRVYLDGPYGAFTIGNPADMHVLIAGGIGITPMMRTGLHQRRGVPAIPAAALRRPRVFYLRTQRDDGCHRKSTRRDARADVEVPFRTLQLRLGRPDAPFVRRPAGARHGFDRGSDGGPVRSLARGWIDGRGPANTLNGLCRESGQHVLKLTARHYADVSPKASWAVGCPVTTIRSGSSNTSSPFEPIASVCT